MPEDFIHAFLGKAYEEYFHEAPVGSDCQSNKTTSFLPRVFSVWMHSWVVDGTHFTTR